MNLGSLLSSASRIAKSGLGVGPRGVVQTSADRITKAQTRIEQMRKTAVTNKDLNIRGGVQASSSRSLLASRLGKKEGPQQGTSLARSLQNQGNGTGNLSARPLAMPPALPPLANGRLTRLPPSVKR